MDPAYGIPNPVYYNPQQINNQMNPIPNQIFADANNNLPPSSVHMFCSTFVNLLMSNII
jgi:hypothetical protein